MQIAARRSFLIVLIFSLLAVLVYTSGTFTIRVNSRIHRFRHDVIILEDGKKMYGSDRKIEKLSEPVIVDHMEDFDSLIKPGEEADMRRERGPRS